MKFDFPFRKWTESLDGVTQIWRIHVNMHIAFSSNTKRKEMKATVLG